MAKKEAQKRSPQKKKSTEKKAAKKVVLPFLKVGARAPSFSLPNESGKLVSFPELKGKKLVLYFYPKDHTSGCTQESCDFRDQFHRLKKAGVAIFGVSRDSISSHEKFKEKLNLPFSLLSDESGKMCDAYGVWKEKSMYGRKYMGIERTTVIIDEDGKISHVFPKVSVTGHVDEVLEILEKNE